jgi:predicted ATP-dependent endonuclease of OLD family
MKLISEIVITGFRSIRHQKLKGLDDFTAFSGLNNSGKSNFLRALNAFFNNETDEGVRLNVDADYYRPDLRTRRKAKEITVTVRFALPSEFKFRKGLEGVQSLLTSSNFSISKRWRRNQLPIYYLENQELDLNETIKIDQFLQLIKFRYIPNRVLPTDVIRKEHQGLRDVLLRRLGRKTTAHDEAFKAIKDTSAKMVEALVGRLTEASPDIGAIRLATPTSWADMWISNSFGRN